MSSLSVSDSGYPASSGSINGGSGISSESGSDYQKLAASDQEVDDEHDGGRWTNGGASDQASDLDPSSSRATYEF